MNAQVTSKTEGSRLSAAAKAAALAGSAAALAAPNAQAVPIPASNVPISISFNNPGPFEWDVDNNGQFDFRLFVESDYAIHLASYPSGNGRGMVNFSGSGIDDVVNLPKGFLIGPTLPAGAYFGRTTSTYRQMVYRSKYTFSGIPYTYSGIGYDADGFSEGVPGCIGFRFTDGFNMFYGWAKIQIDLGADPTLTILESYYNNEPDAPIGCCETTTPVPESASTASLLALGAAGLALYRRRMAARSAA